MADANDFGSPGTSQQQQQQQRDSRPADSQSSHNVAVPDEMVSSSNPENLTEETKDTVESDESGDAADNIYAVPSSEENPAPDIYFEKVFSGVITPNGCFSRVFSKFASQISTGNMKRSQPATSNGHKRRKPSDGHRATVRDPLPNIAATLIQDTSTATLPDAQESQRVDQRVRSVDDED